MNTISNDEFVSNILIFKENMIQLLKENENLKKEIVELTEIKTNLTTELQETTSKLNRKQEEFDKLTSENEKIKSMINDIIVILSRYNNHESVSDIEKDIYENEKDEE